MPFEKDPNERGCLWEKQGAKGTYFTGMVDGEPIVVFKNATKKEGSKAPDYRIFRPKPKDPAVTVPSREPGEDVLDDPIPF